MNCCCQLSSLRAEVRMVLSSVMFSPWPCSHAGSAATATTRSVSVGRLPGPEHSEHTIENSVQITLTRPAASHCWTWTTCAELSPRPALARHQGQQRQQTEGEAPHLLQLQINTFTVYSLYRKRVILMYYISLSPTPRYALRYNHRSYLSDYIRRTQEPVCCS